MVDLLLRCSVGWQRLRTRGAAAKRSVAKPGVVRQQSPPPFPTGRADDRDAVRSPLMVPASGASPRARGEPPFSPHLRPLSPRADRVSLRWTLH
ncbi:hypothetical protein NDU88_003576 [Pleurodeles waltl]|uniref:Uncharacterized protein n=1 Tax=Pleurodeles waltl TaxID=8319 RepID=A0AAV7ME67_PLEWA|nr:hypothetical protein NDU88_003576 [Pleurodeles waltl]